MYKLRELERRDLTEINQWRNREELISLLEAPFRYINLEVDSKWFDSYMLNRNSTIRCVITEDDSDCILGMISLTDVDYLFQSASLHIMIGDKSNQNKGIGTFAVTTMLHHAFYNMNLHRIELDVLADNQRAIHLYEKAGFVREGTKRKVVYKNGEFKDMLSYAVLKEEYLMNKNMGVMPELYHVPSYCINRIEAPSERIQYIKVCGNAFEKQYFDDQLLMDKVSIAAEFIVAIQDATLGYCAYYSNDVKTKSAYITLIAVKKEHQGRHIGQALLDAVVSDCKIKRMKTIRLEVRKDNLTAIRFYIKNGFEIVDNKTEITFIMSRTL